MKKIATLTMLLFAVLTTQAQSLIGTWQTSMPVDGGNLPLFITFNADKSLRFEFQIPVNDEDLGFLKFSFLPLKKNDNCHNLGGQNYEY